MHQIQVVCIVRHLEGSPWFEQYLREVAAEQRLIASITSEVGTGGDMGKSVAAVSDPDGGVASFEKQAPTVSYGGHADAFLTTVRRAPDAEPGDQVLVLSTSRADRAGPAGQLGPARNARHLLSRVRRHGRVPSRAGPRHPLLADLERVDDAGLAHPLVARLARDRDRRLRPRPRLRPRRRQAQARRAASRRDPPLRADERALVAARRGLARRCASSATRRRTGRGSPSWRRSCASTT